jgi:hypothetical protein
MSEPTTLAFLGTIFVGVMAVAWCFAAIRVRTAWVLWALAVIATFEAARGAFISFVVSRGAPLPVYALLTYLQLLLAAVQALLYVLFAFWLVRTLRATRKI